jgi:hypothetical protein
VLDSDHKSRDEIIDDHSNNKTEGPFVIFSVVANLHQESRKEYIVQ